MTYKQQDVEDWLNKHLPHIKLIEYGGKCKAISTLVNTETNYKFKKSISAIKNDYKRGRHIGLSPEQRQLVKKKTWERKYGVSHPKKTQKVNQKYKQTCLKKYGSENYFGSKEWLDKSKKTYKCKLGVDNPAKSKEVQRKIEDTNLSRYGVRRYALKDAAKIEGKYIRELGDNLGLSKSYINKLIKLGIDPTAVDTKNVVEGLMQNVLKDDLNVSFVYDKKLTGCDYRPDFLLPAHNLIIECDGLYWHSDVLLPKYYHFNKKSTYESLGYRVLFFREDEIIQKLDIIKSIVKNALNLSNKIHARKTTIAQINNSLFFEENHLMGKGQGRVYGLFYNDNLVSAMQIKGNDEIEISRFCHKQNYIVVGGFSKLLSYIEKVENPTKVKTFIDLRYGNGNYLQNLGFTYKGAHLTFKWTKQREAVHRMKYPGNSGYDYGYKKIWDCGQAKWEKTVKYTHHQK